MILLAKINRTRYAFFTLSPSLLVFCSVFFFFAASLILFFLGIGARAEGTWVWMKIRGFGDLGNGFELWRWVFFMSCSLMKQMNLIHPQS